MNKRRVRYVCYILITIFCIFAVFTGVYSQFFKKEAEDNTNYGGNSFSNSVSYAEVKDSFKNLFSNNFLDNGYDDSEITKTDKDKPLIYTSISLDEESDGKYDINVSLPVVNIQGVSYNSITQNNFVNKLNDIIDNAQVYTICDMNYTAYINDDILSVAIMASIKEGDSAQRIIIQTYNYNLKTGQDVSINDILQIKELNLKDVDSRIKTIVRKVAEDSESMHSTGYNVFERDTESEIYNVENIDCFILGPQGELYIIFAYGNDSFTSEMDIIAF